MADQGRSPAGSAGRPRKPPRGGSGSGRPSDGSSGSGRPSDGSSGSSGSSGTGGSGLNVTPEMASGDKHQRRDAVRKNLAGAKGEAVGRARGTATGAAKGAAGGAAKGAAREGGKRAAIQGVKGASKGAQTGAKAGSQIGSAVPIVGTAIGGAVGGVAGGAAGGAAGSAKGAAQGAAKGSSKGAQTGAKKGAQKGGDKGAAKGRQKAEGKSDDKAQERASKRSDKQKGGVGDSKKDAALDKGQKTADKLGKVGGVVGKGASIVAKTAMSAGKSNKSGKDKKRLMLAMVILSPLILLVGVLGISLIVVIGAAGGSAGASAATSGQYAIRDGVPGASLGFYQDAGTETDVPWQVLAAIGSRQTNHGQNAPDGKIRVYGENNDGLMLEDAAWSGQEPEGEPGDEASTETTAASTKEPADDDESRESEDRPVRTTTTVPADAGSLWPVTDPPIIDDTPISTAAPAVVPSPAETITATTVASDEAEPVETTTTIAATTTTAPSVEVDGGPWLGIHLIEQDAWTDWVAADTNRRSLDPQKPNELTTAVGYLIHEVRNTMADDPSVTTTTIEGADIGGVRTKFTGDFRDDKDSWIANLSALPLKGLSNNPAAPQAAESIYNMALAWMELQSSCGPASGSTLGGGSMPTAGPLKIGDTLAYLGHNIKLTEARWANAVLIADVGKSMGLSDRAQIIAIATSIPETNLLNLQPEIDLDSRGLFQQRPAAGWGTPAEVSDAIYAARAFYGGPTGPNKGSPPGLLDKAGWETGDPGAIAQSVQGSAHPTRYTAAMADAVGIHATIKASNATFGITTATPIGAFPVLDSDSTPLPAGLLTGGVAPSAPTTTAPTDGSTPTTVAGEVPEGTPAVTPAPTNVLLVGDSLTVGAKESGGLPSGWTVDALTGRPTLDGGPIISEKGVDVDGIVIALGTNDYGDSKEAFATKIDTTMALVGSGKKVWWVNADAGSTKIAAVAEGVNAALAEAPARHPNLQIADWSAAAAAAPGFADMRADDNVHYTPEGYKVYAAFLSTVASGLPTSVAGDCSTDNGSGEFGAINIDTGAPVAICPIQSATTNCAILPNLEAMIAQAASQGVTLTVGNSYRSVAQQIELRKSHCGTSHYAIYEMPSGQCSPPTATPGRSNHQKGLAIDFANCSSRGTACYQWLAANAAGFGFKNLPSEAWHWSVDGN